MESSTDSLFSSMESCSGGLLSSCSSFASLSEVCFPNDEILLDKNAEKTPCSVSYAEEKQVPASSGAKAVSSEELCRLSQNACNSFSTYDTESANEAVARGSEGRTTDQNNDEDVKGTQRLGGKLSWATEFSHNPHETVPQTSRLDTIESPLEPNARSSKLSYKQSQSHHRFLLGDATEHTKHAVGTCLLPLDGALASEKAHVSSKASIISIETNSIVDAAIRTYSAVNAVFPGAEQAINRSTQIKSKVACSLASVHHVNSAAKSVVIQHADSVTPSDLLIGRKELLKSLTMLHVLHHDAIRPHPANVAAFLSMAHARAQQQMSQVNIAPSSYLPETEAQVHLKAIHSFSPPPVTDSVQNADQQGSDAVSGGRSLAEQVSTPSSIAAVVSEPLDFDILLGRGHRLNNHPGNSRFRAFIQQFRSVYKCTTIADRKTSMTELLVSRCREPFVYKGKMVASRFLRFRADLNMWEEVQNEVARRKIAHLLRAKRSGPIRTKRT